jgi:phage terminase small subunit
MRQGETYTTQRGAVRARPEVKIARDAEGSFARWAAAFGFTPADRARIRVAPPSFHWDDEF